MTKGSVRRVQVTCFALAHIPLVAVAAYAVSDGLSENASFLIVAFLSTLVTAIALTAYLGKTLDARMSAQSA